MKDKKGQLAIIIFLIIIILVVSSITIFLVNLGCKKECKMESEIMGLEWKYNFWIDCMVKTPNGVWIAKQNYIINKPEEKK